MYFAFYFNFSFRTIEKYFIFINQTLILSQKIWQYRVDNKFGTNEETREKNLRKQLQPKIEQAYKHSEIISIYHAKLLRVPIERRLTFSSTTNKRWLIHINSAEKSFQRNQTKELLKLKKITHFFKPPQQKRSPANTNIPNKRHKTTTLHHTKTKQQTITGIPYKNQPTPNQNNTPKIKYKKRKYLSMTNFIKGQKKNKTEIITFLENPVKLSTIRVPYINRQNKKFSQITLQHDPP